MYRLTIYHSNLSYQSAREISVRIRVRLKSCTILAFLRRIRKVSTLSSENVTYVNLVLKERTHMRLCINMLIFMHNLGKWLIVHLCFSGLFSSAPLQKLMLQSEMQVTFPLSRS